MDDEQEAGSGSRWESDAPRPDDETTELATPSSAPDMNGKRGAWMRTRGAMMGASVGLAAAIGLGGFAIGHATAEIDGGHRPGPGFHHFDGDRDGNRRGPGQRMDGPGQLPGAPQGPPNAAPSSSPSADEDSSSGGDDQS